MENKFVYVVFKPGVYGHGVYGVFTDPEIAINESKKAMEREMPGHQKLEILKMKPDKMCKNLAGYSVKMPLWKVYAEVICHCGEITVTEGYSQVKKMKIEKRNDERFYQQMAKPPSKKKSNKK